MEKEIGFCRGLSCTTPDHVDADYKSNPVVPAHSRSFSSYLTLSAINNGHLPIPSIYRSNLRSMKKVLGFVLTLSIIGITPAYATIIDTRMIDGIKIKSPTRVQAGKYFKVKIISKSEKISL